MTHPSPQIVPEADPGDLASRGPGLPRGEFPCVVRHLACAAADLAGAPDASADRFRRAEGVLRGLADAGRARPGAPRRMSGGVDGPVVAIHPDATVSMAELLAHAWRRHGRPFPDRAIDPDMVEAARQLLRGLSWHLPA